MNFTKKGNDDEKEIYFDRTVGSDSHHRNISGYASAGTWQSQSPRTKGGMLKQS